MGIACNKSDDGIPPVNPDGKPNETTIQVELQPQALQRTGKVSKSTAELDPSEDRAIHNLWAVQFDATSNKTRIGVPYYTDIISTGTGGSCIH